MKPLPPIPPKLNKQVHAYAFAHSLNCYEAFNILGLLSEFENHFDEEAAPVVGLPQSWSTSWPDLADKSPCQCWECTAAKEFTESGKIELKMSNADPTEVAVVNGTISSSTAKIISDSLTTVANGDWQVLGYTTEFNPEPALNNPVVVSGDAPATLFIQPSAFGSSFSVSLPSGGPASAPHLKVVVNGAGQPEIHLTIPGVLWQKFYDAFFDVLPQSDPNVEEIELKGGEQLLIAANKDCKVVVPKSATRVPNRPKKGALAPKVKKAVKVPKSGPDFLELTVSHPVDPQPGALLYATHEGKPVLVGKIDQVWDGKVSIFVVKDPLYPGPTEYLPKPKVIPSGMSFSMMWKLDPWTVA